MAKFQILKKSEEEKKYSEINLKKGNPTFLPLDDIENQVEHNDRWSITFGISTNLILPQPSP